MDKSCNSVYEKHNGQTSFCWCCNKKLTDKDLSPEGAKLRLVVCQDCFSKDCYKESQEEVMPEITEEQFEKLPKFNNYGKVK